MVRRIDLFDAGRPLCVPDKAFVREVAGHYQEVVFCDLRTDKAAAGRVAERGIGAAPAVVDRLPRGCCNSAGSDCDELVAVGVGHPPG